MRELYTKVYKNIDKVDFDSIWNGFSRCDFALYDKEHVYLKNEVIPYDNRFLGNTAINYDGSYIAIWYIENSSVEDSDILAADIVHEMFHAFQKEKGETRFPSDLKMLDYPYSEENLSVKYSENLLLARAFLAQDVNEKNALLSHFMTARKYREGLIGDIIKQEYLSETIEGMAEYAGSTALKQISKAKYNSRVEGYIKNLQVFDERFFDIRRMLYYTGAVYCITLTDAGESFYHNIGDMELPLFDFASKNASIKKPNIEVDIQVLSAKIKQYLDDKKIIIENFLNSHNNEVIGNFIICGYDPMNMIKWGNEILHNHFVMLMRKDDNEPLFVQGPVIIRLKDGSVNEVLSYIT